MKDIVIFLGVPGSGKGTQAKSLAEELGWSYISTGDLFRKLLADPATDPSDKKMLEGMKEGKLMPDDFIFRVTFAEIENSLAMGKGLALDGVVRTMSQAQRFYEFFKEKGLLGRFSVILIDISDEEAVQRLAKRRVCGSCGNGVPWFPETKDLDRCPKCGGALETRIDDTVEAIGERMKKQGNADVKPLFEFFNSFNLAEAIDGIGTIKEVAERIKDAIKS